MKTIYQIRFNDKKLFGNGISIPEDGAFFESVVDASIALKSAYKRIKKSVDGRKITGWCQKFKDTDGADVISFYDRDEVASFNATKIYGNIVEYNVYPAGYCQRKYSVDWEIKEGNSNSVLWNCKDFEKLPYSSDNDDAIKKFDTIKKELIARYETTDNNVKKTTTTHEEYTFNNAYGEVVSIIKEEEIYFTDGTKIKTRLLLL